MSVEIRKMIEADAEEVLSMMRVFYDSPAVLFTAPDAVLEQDVKDCVGACPFLEGYVFEEDDKILGYSMVALSYTTEYGGFCVWVEDMYVKPEYRSQGLASRMFDFIEEQYKTAIRFKLEVEAENERAIELYKRKGYNISDYYLMTKER